VEFNCTLIKVDWLAACTVLHKEWFFGAVFIISSGAALAYNLHSPPANGKQRQILEEMSQTLLTNKKQGNMDYKYMPLTLLSQRKLFTARNTLYKMTPP
jgi:hypothetical protein